MNEAMDAYWLEQVEANVPTGNQWLSAAENSRLAALRFSKRSTEWRLGRWTAKRALATSLNLPGDIPSLQDIEIQAAPSGAPEVFLFRQRAPVALSLSHRAGRALCFVALSEASIGCDLELVESRDHSFVSDFFTADEQKLIERTPAGEQSTLLTLLWSAKESALKAMRVGLRQNTTTLEVIPAETAAHCGQESSLNGAPVWAPLSIHCVCSRVLRGWWRCTGNFVRTVVFDSSRSSATSEIKEISKDSRLARLYPAAAQAVTKCSSDMAFVSFRGAYKTPRESATTSSTAFSMSSSRKS